MKKSLPLFLFFTLIIIFTLVLSYQLNKQADIEQNMEHELEITIEGGGKKTRHNIEQIIIFRDKNHKLKYLKILYNKKSNQEELYNLDRVINLNYHPKIKERIIFKPLAELRIKAADEN